MVMATWPNWLHLMDMEEIIAPEEINKTKAPEETNETKAFMEIIIAPEEIFETNKELATGTRAMAMLEEPTSTRMPVVEEMAEEKVESPTILHFLYFLTEINSLLLT